MAQAPLEDRVLALEKLVAKFITGHLPQSITAPDDLTCLIPMYQRLRRLMNWTLPRLDKAQPMKSHTSRTNSEWFRISMSLFRCFRQSFRRTSVPIR